MRFSFLFILSVFFCSCSVSQKSVVTIFKNSFYPIVPIHETENWQYKDIIKDTLAGISLEKAYKELVLGKNDDTITVATIGTPIDINHEHLKNSIWINTAEIPNNNIDDDNNGYIDDIHGWNFLGNAKGTNDIYMQLEVTRLLKKYEAQQLTNTNEPKYILAKNIYDSIYKVSKKEYDHYSSIHEAYTYIKSEFAKKSLFGNYSIKKLDSIQKTYANDWYFQNIVKSLINFERYVGGKNIVSRNELYTKHIHVLLNKEYNDRELQGDNPNDLEDAFYGNNIVNHNVDKLKQGTSVAGLLVRSPNSPVEGISSYIKLMPICVSGYGSAHDKDIALAIKYAVDNGAKVIHLDATKLLSLKKEWVFEAFRYAEKHNVLIVAPAGNASANLTTTNYYFPNDNIDNGKKVANNFLLVGASTYEPNEKLVASFSNYGSIDVDIFAPATEIYTTTTCNTYDFQDSTAMASSLTAGVAALLFLKYPNLSAAEIKQIIMDSGVSYDIMVNKPSASKEKELVPFSSLSKSGKIVNAYNALMMAKEVSEKKTK
ncbi:MAG: S8 family serine peptidase [Bacteroidota bacterium]